MQLKLFVNFLLNQQMGLGQQPVSGLGVWQNLIIVNTHLTDQFIITLSLLFKLFKFRLSFNMAEPVFEPFFLSRQLLLNVVLKRKLHEQSACHRVYCLLVHFFNVFDEGSKRYFVCWFYQPNSRQQKLGPHFVDDLGNFALDFRLQSCLVPVL